MTRTALITGASSGIGAAIAAELAARGHRLVLCGRDEAALRRVAEGLPGEALGHRLDLADRDSVDTVLQRLPAAFGDIDVLVNAAGHDVGGRSLFTEGSADDWASIIETNLTGLVRLTRLLCEPMIAKKGGDIVNIGSLAALRPNARMAPYAASKAGVHMFTDVLRAELTRHDIRVIEVLPGLTRTNLAERRMRGDTEGAARFYDRAGTSLAADDVARSVAFALDQPRHVVIAQMLVVPSGQW